MNKYYNISQDH